MTSIWPVLTSRLNSSSYAPYLRSSPLWNDPDRCLGAIFDGFSRPTVLSIRITPHRSMLGRPVTFFFPQENDFPKKIAVHDSNDVADIHRELSPGYDGAAKLDISLVTGYARRILEQDDPRESFFSQICKECVFPATNEGQNSVFGIRMAEVFGTKDLAAFLPETEGQEAQDRTRFFPTIGQLRQTGDCPDFLMAAPEQDILLPICAPGLAGISNHEALIRRQAFSGQTELILKAMDLGSAFDLHPLTQ